MGRTPKPWWRESRKAYYATVQGILHKLGTTKKEAESELRRLLDRAAQNRADKASSERVGVVFDRFIDWTRRNRTKKAFQSSEEVLDSFFRCWPNLPIDELSPKHMIAWLANHPSWDDDAQRQALTAINQATRWWILNHGITEPLQTPKKDRDARCRRFNHLVHLGNASKEANAQPKSDEKQAGPGNAEP